MNSGNSQKLMRTKSVDNVVDRIKSISFVKIVVVVDVFFIVCTFLRRGFPHLSNNEYLSWMTSRFDLSVEMNFAIWWSSILLFLIGLLAYQNSLLSENDTQLPWLGISIIFVGLSIDEIGSLHERIQYWSLLAPVALVCIIVLSYSLLKLFRRTESRFAAVLISVAIFLFALTAFQEFLEQTFKWSSWAIGLRAIIEEGTELCGSLVGLIGVVSFPGGIPRKKLADLPPSTSTIEGVKNVLLVFLLAHFVLSIFVHSWSHFTRWGNPVVWYPMVVYFILFLYALRKSSARKGNSDIVVLGRSVICLIVSAIIPYVFVCTRILNFSDERWIFDRSFVISFLTLYYVLQFLLVALFLNKKNRKIAVFVSTLLILIGDIACLIYYRNLVMVFMVVGLNSYLFFRLMVMDGASVEKDAQVTGMGRDA